MLAFDKSTARTKDENGFLHVKTSHISKEVVNPYMGQEIPGYKELGLDAAKVYQCYRKGSELRAGAETFNGLPILLGHFAESAEAPQKDKRIGSMGTDAKFTAPYLDNSLIFTDQKAIDAIEAGDTVELSCSYRWTPVVQSGKFNGQAYDIIMTEIRGNHLGLVEEGRAGSDVLVHDEKPKGLGVSIKDKAVKLVASITGLLANDGIEKKEEDIIGKIGEAVEEFQKVHKEESNEMKKEAAAMDGEGMKEAFGKMSKDEQKKTMDGFAEMMKAKKEEKAEDEDPEAEDEKDEKAEDQEEEKKEKAEDEDPEEKEESDDKAMDAAISKAKDDMKAHYKALDAAANDVRPVIGHIDALSFDSADAIYGKALEMQKVNTKGFEPSAYKGMFSVLKTNRASAKVVPLANDSAATLSGSFAGLKNVKIG